MNLAPTQREKKPLCLHQVIRFLRATVTHDGVTMQKVDPKLQRTLKAKSLLKSCMDHKYACIYELDAGL